MKIAQYICMAKCKLEFENSIMYPVAIAVYW